VGPLLVRIKRLEERRRRERSVVDLVDFSLFAGKNALVVMRLYSSYTLRLIGHARTCLRFCISPSSPFTLAYTFPVSRRIMSKITLVETAMKREIILRSTPSWAPTIGNTIRKTSKIKIP
jgi:hypothetical protein